MPDRDATSAERAIGNLCMISERSVTHRSPKLAEVEPGSPESFYMLATFCFDLSRRMNQLYKATRALARAAEPELASEILRDNEAINKAGMSWQQRAEAAEQIMLRLVAEIGEEHQAVLREIAGGAASSDSPKR